MSELETINGSKYEQQRDDDWSQCPYCGNKWEVESCSYSEDSRVEECGECGKKYHLHQVFTVEHVSTPDCELNGESHLWEPRSLGGGRTHPFCSVCDKCKVYRS
jgi:hypothetical protein